jgi:hypothetical protein
MFKYIPVKSAALASLIVMGSTLLGANTARAEDEIANFPPKTSCIIVEDNDGNAPKAPYNPYQRDEGMLGKAQEVLSKILPIIGKGVKKIAPEAYDNYFVAAEKADAAVEEAMNKDPEANLYVELIKNGYEPAKVVVTDFAIPAYNFLVDLAKDTAMSIAKKAVGFLGKFFGK